MTNATIKTTYAIAGMSCAHCETSILEEVQAVRGVGAADADHAAATLVVTGDADPGAVKAAVQEAGYEVVA